MQGKINRGRHTDHPAGRHSIQTNQCHLHHPPCFLQAGYPSCHPTNSVKALKAKKPQNLTLPLQNRLGPTYHIMLFVVWRGLENCHSVLPVLCNKHKCHGDHVVSFYQRIWRYINLYLYLYCIVALRLIRIFTPATATKIQSNIPNLVNYEKIIQYNYIK